jgi:hypothetical protein
LDNLIKILGHWDIEQQKKNPQRKRIIFNKKICIGNKLVVGAYFDVVDNKIVKAKGIKSKEKLQRLIANKKKPKPDIKPLKYTDNIPEEHSAKKIVTQLVLLREAGNQNKAKNLLSDKLQSDFIINEITRKADRNSPIKMQSFTYQATKYTHDSAYITVVYYLENGSLIKTKHKVIRENGLWRIVF